MSAALAEVAFYYSSKTEPGEEIKDSGKAIKFMFKVLVLTYPLLWSYDFYNYFINPLL
jgi:hypothetical protein